MTRTIFHLDLDAFFCAVEEQRDPNLRGVAFAVGGTPDRRGVVASCSYAARTFGIHSAMPMSQAVRLCPDLVIVSHNFGDYRAASRKVMAYLHDLTPLVEQISIDEAFLDVTGIKDANTYLPEKVQRHIRDALDLPCSLGVASNKLVAKIANNIGKSRSPAAEQGEPPNAITIVPVGAEAPFLAPLPIRELWGIGPKTAEKMHKLGIRTVGDIAVRSRHELSTRFGKHGDDLYDRARGIDNRPVQPEHEAKSISKETTFAQDVRDEDQLTRTLRKLCDGVGREVRKKGFMGKTVTIKLRWSDFTTISRQITLSQPINQDDEIYIHALSVFHKSWSRGRPVRLLGIALSGFNTPARQLSLWETPTTEEDRRLQSTLDQLRDRFGDTTIKRASDLD